MNTLLFDWGDTLMVDYPQCRGKMRDWDKVAAVPGAKEMLREAALTHGIYVATNAAESNEEDIAYAFRRVGLDGFISGYFCRANLGIGKDSPEFYLRIAKKLNTPVSQITMIGDSLDRDILPARKAGLRAIWLASKSAALSNVEHIERTESLAALRMLLSSPSRTPFHV